MMTMTNDLWHAAASDPHRERVTAALEVAERALAGQFAIVSEASTKTAFEDRMAVIGGRVEAVVLAATNSDPVLFPIVHQALLTQWEHDFDRMATIRRQEGQRRNNRRAFERNAARRQAGICDVNGTPLAVGDTVQAASGSTYTIKSIDGPDAVGLTPTAWNGVGSPPGDAYASGLLKVNGSRQAVRKQAWRYAPGTPQYVIDDFERLDKGLASFIRSGNDGTEDFSYIDPSAPPALVSAYQTLMQMAFANGWLQPGSGARVVQGAARKHAVKGMSCQQCGNDLAEDEFSDVHIFTMPDGSQVLQAHCFQCGWDGTKIKPKAAAKDDGELVDWDKERERKHPTSDLVDWEYEKQRKGGSVKAVAYTQTEADSIATTIPVHARERLTPFLPYIVYGPSYNRSVAENLWDAIKFAGDPTAQQSYEYVLSKLDAATSANPGNWYIDHEKHVYTERLDGTMGSKTAAEYYQPTHGEMPGTWNVFPRNGGESRLGVPYDELPEEVKGYIRAGGDRVMTVTLDPSQQSINPFGAKRPPTGPWVTGFVDTLRSTGMATIGFTGRSGARRAITLVHEGSLVHWAVTDDTGEKEDGSGSGESVRDTLEQAWDLLNKVLDKQPPPTGDVAEQAQQAEEAVGEAVDAAGGSAGADQPPAAKGDQKAKDAAPADDKGDAKFPPKGDEADAKGDDQGDLQPQIKGGQPDASKDSEAAPPPASDKGAGDDAPAAPAPEVAPAQPGEEPLDGGGVDPKSMQPGERVDMTYTMVDGTTGSVEVTFVREDNEIYFFDGPNGEFGIGERNEEWVDSDGNSFSFGTGNPVEEITGDAELPGGLEDIQLDAPVTSGDQTPAKGEAPPEGEGDDPKGDKDESDDEDDEDDFDNIKEKAKKAMLRDNPGMPRSTADVLARRAALLTRDMR